MSYASLSYSFFISASFFARFLRVIIWRKSLGRNYAQGIFHKLRAITRNYVIWFSQHCLDTRGITSTLMSYTRDVGEISFNAKVDFAKFANISTITSRTVIAFKSRSKFFDPSLVTLSMGDVSNIWFWKFSSSNGTKSMIYFSKRASHQHMVVFAFNFGKDQENFNLYTQGTAAVSNVCASLRRAQLAM